MNALSLRNARQKADALVSGLRHTVRFVRRRHAVVSRCDDLFIDAAFPTVDFRDLIGSDAPMLTPVLRFWPDLYGDVSWQELVVLSSLVAVRRPRRIFEFGTFVGKTTFHLASNAPADATIFTLDLPVDGFEGYLAHAPYDRDLLVEGRRREVGACFRGTTAAGKIHQLFCDSRSFDESPYRGTIDLVFVDADHTYDSVRSDTLKALRMLGDSPVRLILWHDTYAGSEAERALFDLRAETGPVARIRGTSLAVLTPRR